MAARDQVRRLSHSLPARAGGRPAAEPQRQGLDGPILRHRHRRRAPARAHRPAGRRGGGAQARRHHELSGAAATTGRRPRRRHARLHGLRPLVSGRTRSPRGAAREPEGRPGSAPLEGEGHRRTRALLRTRDGRREGVPSPRLRARPRGRGVQAAGRPVHLRSQHELAQDQVSQATGSGDRRLHGTGRRARGARRPPGRGARGRTAPLRGEGRHGLLGRGPPRAHPAPPAPPTARQPLQHGAPFSTSPLGGAPARRRSRLHRVDGRRAYAPSLVPGFARGQARPRGRSRARHRDRERRSSSGRLRLGRYRSRA